MVAAFLSFKIKTDPTFRISWASNPGNNSPITRSDRSKSEEIARQASSDLRKLFERHPDFVTGSLFPTLEASARAEAGTLLPRLSKVECAALLDEIKSGTIPDWFEEPLFQRLGELDHALALTLLGENPAQWHPSSPKLGAYGAIVRGYSKTNPSQAWHECEALIRNLGSPTLATLTLPTDIFKNWSAQDRDAAFQMIGDVPEDYLGQAIRGYLLGLPLSSDFATAASQIANLKELNASVSPWFRKPEIEITHLFSSKWMDADPEAASQYWLTETANIPNLKFPEDLPSLPGEAARLSGLVNHWVYHLSNYDNTVPDRAMTWLRNHPEILQNPGFQEEGFNALAEKAPERVLDLIRDLDSKDQQIRLLLDGLKYLSSGDLPYQPRITRAFSPEMIEKEMATGRFSAEQIERLQIGISRRYEMDPHLGQ